MALTLAGGSTLANAAIVSRNVNVTLSAANLDSYSLDLNLDGTTDFTFQAAYVPDPVLTVGFDQIEFPFASTNAAVVDTQGPFGFPPASRLPVGSNVSSTSLFSGPNDQANLYSFDSLDPTTGNFGGNTGYVGLRFTGPGGTFFGFAQVSVNDQGSASPADLTIGTVGYNNVAGQPVSVPEPAAAGVVAAAGLLAVRRRRR